VLGGIAALALGGYIFKDQIKGFLDFFINAVDEWGPLVSSGGGAGGSAARPAGRPAGRR
jgi:hypothetical protein